MAAESKNGASASGVIMREALQGAGQFENKSPPFQGRSGVGGERSEPPQCSARENVRKLGRSRSTHP
jgi:hypothetical protein